MLLKILPFALYTSYLSVQALRSISWLSSESESEFYITTDGQSASLSWNKVPIWGLRPDCYYCQTVADLLTWGAPWREDVFCLQLLLVLASVVVLGSESRLTRDHILLTQVRDFPFRRLLRLAGLQWRYSTPPPHGILNLVSLLTPRHGPHRNTVPSLLYHCCVRVCCCGEVFTEPLPRNGYGISAYLAVVA
jgi:hypothetical protein